MTQPKEKMRAEFEAHAKRNGLCIDRAPCQRGVSEKYWSAQTQQTWEGWRSASEQQSTKSQQDALDAERYRWLASDVSRGDGDLCAARFNWSQRNHEILSGENLNSAIDAAIAAQSKGENA